VATAHGHANIMELLLTRGANLPHNAAILYLAVFSGSVAAVELLVKRGVPVNCRDPRGEIPPLYVACSKSAGMVNALLSAGADPNLGEKRHKPVCNVLPLHRRPAADTADIVRLLVLHNADMNVLSTDYTSQQPLTLLQRALICGESSVITLLLRAAVVHTHGITDGMLSTFCSKSPPTGVVQLLKYHRHNPYSLAQLSRVVIRQHSGHVFNMQQLPLPAPLLDYVLLTGLNSLA